MSQNMHGRSLDASRPAVSALLSVRSSQQNALHRPASHDFSSLHITTRLGSHRCCQQRVQRMLIDDMESDDGHALNPLGRDWVGRIDTDCSPILHSTPHQRN